MHPVLDNLEPKAVWKHFDAILGIPHGSKNENAIRQHIVMLARDLGLEHLVDEAGNVVVRKKASAGKEKAPVVVLQGHMDMVCEKNNDTDHDFNVDPIVPRIVDGFVYGTGTTLGADNGLGIAAMMAVMESTTMVHGPLEFLFTVDEETGLTGAFALDPKLLTGKYLLNLDSEEDWTITIGCAGGGDSKIALPLVWTDTTGGKAIRIKLHGLRGGHSGVDIHEQRGNAVKLLGRVLFRALKDVEFQIADFNGGDKHNAIPREASAVLVTAKDGEFSHKVIRELASIKEEYATIDPGMTWTIDEVDRPARILDLANTGTLLSLVRVIPHGVIAYSNDIKGLVETSNNLASVKVGREHARLQTSTRSSVASALHGGRDIIRAACELSGATFEMGEPYPGWKPNVKSPLLAMTVEIYKEVNGKDPEVQAIHAGLETGIIGEKCPGMDMISIGPYIRNPHSPDESMKVDTVPRFFDLLERILVKLAQ